MSKKNYLVYLVALFLVLISNIVTATTIDNEIFISKAKDAKLKPRKTEFVDIMGNKVKSMEVKHSSHNILGITRYVITCDSTLENSTLFVAVGVNFMDEKQKDSTEPIPATLVINNEGKRIDIPVERYIYDSGRSALFGAWAEYRFNIPVYEFKKLGVTKIDALSVILKNPQTNVEVSYEPILQKNELKRINKLNSIYKFYVSLEKQYNH